MEEKNTPWYIFDVYTSKGGKITCKLIDPRTFESDFAALMAATQNIVNKFGVTLTPPPLPDAPVKNNQIPLTDETGVPVVDAEGVPQMVELPKGVHVYTVKALFHEKTKTGKDVVKVITVEEPYNTKYGVSAFHGGPEGWKSWPLGVDTKYAPPKGFGHVVIRDPEDDSKYPNVERFQD